MLGHSADLACWVPRADLGTISGSSVTLARFAEGGIVDTFRCRTCRYFSMNRAKRRHHKFRVREKAKRVLKWLMDDLYDETDATKRADHMAGCSCSMCGNPRKYFNERSRQEIVDSDPDRLIDEA